VIAGPDDEGLAAGFADLARGLGLAARVSFVGPLYGEEKRALLKAARVLALPSASENFGNVVAEAMAAGTPVVVSPEVAIADRIQRASAGITVPRVPGAVAAALATYLGSSARAEADGRNGVALAAAEFSWERVGVELERMYLSVTEE